MIKFFSPIIILISLLCCSFIKTDSKDDDDEAMGPLSKFNFNTLYASDKTIIGPSCIPLTSKNIEANPYHYSLVSRKGAEVRRGIGKPIIVEHPPLLCPMDSPSDCTFNVEKSLSLTITSSVSVNVGKSSTLASSVGKTITRGQSNMFSRAIGKSIEKPTMEQYNKSHVDKELLYVIATLREFRSMLLGAEIHIHTDHKNILNVGDSSDLDEPKKAKKKIKQKKNESSGESSDEEINPPPKINKLNNNNNNNAKKASR